MQPPHLIERLPAFPWRAQEQYVIFRDRVRAALRFSRRAADRASYQAGRSWPLPSGRLGRDPVEVEVGMALVLEQAGDPLTLVGDVEVDAVHQQFGPAE